MKTKNFYLKLIITIISLNMFLSCYNNPGGTLIEAPNLVLPPETQTGANTFGCLINGKLLVPRDGLGSFSGSGSKGVIIWGDVTGNQQYNEIDVHDYKSARTANILLHIQNLHQLGVGQYIVNLSNGMTSIDGLNHTYIHCRIFNETLNMYQYYRSFDNSVSIKITRYDSPNQIIQNRIFSGTFSGKLKNSVNASDIIEITDGRFDFNKRTILDQIFL